MDLLVDRHRRLDNQVIGKIDHVISSLKIAVGYCTPIPKQAFVCQE